MEMAIVLWLSRCPGDNQSWRLLTRCNDYSLRTCDIWDRSSSVLAFAGRSLPGLSERTHSIYCPQANLSSAVAIIWNFHEACSPEPQDHLRSMISSMRFLAFDWPWKSTSWKLESSNCCSSVSSSKGKDHTYNQVILIQCTEITWSHGLSVTGSKMKYERQHTKRPFPDLQGWWFSWFSAPSIKRLVFQPYPLTFRSQLDKLHQTRHQVWIGLWESITKPQLLALKEAHPSQ